VLVHEGCLLRPIVQDGARVELATTVPPLLDGPARSFQISLLIWATVQMILDLGFALINLNITPTWTLDFRLNEA
jgi:hypothetical protein